jgi:paired amphipathic helix protein Sin3a
MNVVCSGRDDICRSVLNDEWVSQPTFASEEAGFLAHKKNAYEEALHRSEEERHEYDFHLEAIYRTIQMLEPFNNKINQLSPEDKANYKFKPNLAQAMKSIHLRVIKKVYGKEAGMDVFHALQEVPVVAIPLVLTRLKQKNEEWKRAQREWNKVWKEVDAKNYYKSLDHQGITFKATDKKAITPKTFVSQIEAARDEQMAKRAALIDPLFARTRPRHQLEYVIDDADVLQDALKLVCSFLDRTQIAFTDRKKIETFLRTFVPLFFMLDLAAFNATFVPRREEFLDAVEGDNAADDAGSSQANGARGGRTAKKAGSAPGGDLRKRLLKSEQAKSSRRTRAQDAGSPSSSRPTSPRTDSPALPETMQVDSQGGGSVATNVESTSGPSSPVDQKSGRRGTFFTNTHFYVLFRQLEVIFACTFAV